MSSVRMCDRCGQVFSERSEGWSTFAGSRRIRAAITGKIENVQETMDSCPDCSEMIMGTAPRPELTTEQAQPHYEPGA